MNYDIKDKFLVLAINSTVAIYSLKRSEEKQAYDLSEEKEIEVAQFIFIQKL